MDIRQLQAVVAVAQDNQFTSAAERLGIAQSSLSAQIRSLEQELGLSLFDRTTRRVTLTDAGRTLLAGAQRIIAELDSLTADLAGQRGLLSGHATIGVTPTPGPVDLVALIANFHRLHPAIELGVREGLSVELAQALREDRLDLGLITVVTEEDLRGLEQRPLAVDRLVLVVPASHPLARRKSVQVAELSQESFVLSAPGATIRTTALQAARSAGFEPHVVFESQDTGRIRAIVAAGLGIGVLPRSDALSPGPMVTTVEVEHDDFEHVISLVWRSGRRLSPAAQALRDSVTAGNSVTAGSI